MFTMCIRASTLHWMGCTCHSGGKKGLTSGVSCPSVSWFLVTPFDWESCSGVGGMGRWQSSSFQDVEYSTFSHSIWSVCKTVSSPRMRNHQRISEPSLFLNFLRTSTFSPTLVNFRKVVFDIILDSEHAIKLITIRLWSHTYTTPPRNIELPVELPA